MKQRDSNNLYGLTTEEVLTRESEGLNNKTAKHKTKSLGNIFLENVFSIFNLIILGISFFFIFFYIRTSDFRLLLDSFGIFFVAFLNTIIAIYQEIKAKLALDKVNLLLKKQVTVIRNGQEQVIDQTGIVVDDLIVLNRGDQTIVDGSVVDSSHLEMDESLLTGESIPINKQTADKILSGSFCVAGRGVYKAEQVGSQSYASSLTGLAKKHKYVLTPLQNRINLLIKLLFVIALILVGLEIATEILRPSGITEVDFVRKLATIIISLIPQGLVLFSSVTFALGVYRISKIGAIIQKLNAIESFSNVQVVCMDKTGTLTENRLKIHKLTPLTPALTQGAIQELLGTFTFHSTEKNATIRALAHLPVLPDTEALDEQPFNSSTKMSALALRINGQTGNYILGGFDLLAEKVPAALRQSVTDQVTLQQLGIYRNLLFGKLTATASFEQLKAGLDTIEIEPICIVSITDTVRTDVYAAITVLQQNDISLKVLSGDAPEAITAVLQELGWSLKPEEIITGKALDNLSEDALDTITREKAVFARLKPEHKLQIIRSFRRQKIYTTMIGDGVNDLPAIKEADLGIAMEEGSSITKEVADIVLLKNKFSLLPEIFDEGNKIVNTVNSVAKLFLTKNFMMIFLAVLSMLFMLEFPLTPRRISLINMVGIGLPALVLALKNNNTGKSKNFIIDVFSYVCFSSGIIIAGSYFGLFLVKTFYTITDSQSEMVMTFIMLFLFIVNFIIIALESDRQSKTYWLFSLSLLGVVLFLVLFDFHFFVYKLINEFYELITLSPEHWLVIAPACLLGAFVLVGLQGLRRRLFNISSSEQYLVKKKLLPSKKAN